MATLSLDFLRNYRLGTYRESEPVAYQYDQGHVLNILVPGEVTSAEVQYWTQGMTEAAAYEVGSITQQTDGSYVIECNVPNEYFGTWGDLRVYLVVTDDSKYVVTYEGRIKVLQREKPEDYVDDDPDNEALRVLTEAREAAQSASADADRAAQVAASIPADYSELSGDVSDLTEDVSSLNERLGEVDERVEALEAGGTGSGLTDGIKVALLQLASKVAYIDEHGQDYYQELYDALYTQSGLDSISAVYTQSGTVYDTDDINSLKDNLIVTAHYTDQTSEVIDSSSYNLRGTLTVGLSIITVVYGGAADTFTVTVTHDDWDYKWSYTDGSPILYGFEEVHGGGTSYTAEMRENGFYLDSPSGVYVYYKNADLTARILANNSSGVSETIINIPLYEGSGAINFALLAISDGTNGLHIYFRRETNGARYIYLCTGNGLNSDGTVISTGWDYDTDYTVRLEIGNGLGRIYLNGTLLRDNIDLATVQYAINVRVTAQNGSKGHGFYWKGLRCKYSGGEAVTE